MNPAFIAGVLARELKTLRREVEAYADERDLWRLAPGIRNSAGTLALHLTGNLQHFVGTRLGQSGFVRDRDAEFSRRDAPRAELLQSIDETITVVSAVLPRLGEADLERDYPEPVGGVSLRTGDFLLHLVAHFAYHLGQLDYHRRWVTGQQGQVGAVPVRELSSARPVVAQK